QVATSSQERSGVARDLGGLVRDDDFHGDPRSRRRDAAVPAHRRPVLRLVERDPELVETLETARTDLGTVFSDSTAEHDPIEAAEDREIGADVFPNAVAEDVDRE